MLNNRSILITGGTGSFGKEFVRRIIRENDNIKRLVIYSRDELKQFEMSKEFPVDKYPFIRYFIGDIRDKDRFKRALIGIDTVIHAAALKQVPAAEYNPMEFVKTNVLGAENIIDACLQSEVKDVVSLSTDKAAAPINLYGATKLCSDKLFVAANNIVGKSEIKFSIVRYGNVMGSRGSVIPFFLNQRDSGVLPITDMAMTRFNITLNEAIDLVLHAVSDAKGGEIFVPKIPSYKIGELAEAIGPKCEHKIVGIRPGEKIHEEMITVSDALNTVDIGKYYVILSQNPKASVETYVNKYGAKRVAEDFSYNSGTNEAWLGVEELREMIASELGIKIST